MKLSRHIAVSSAISALIFAATRSVAVSVSTLLTGIFIDVDHVFEYFREYGFKPDVQHFFHTFTDTQYEKLYLFMHAWEWMVLLFTAAALTHWNEYAIGIAVGYSQHLVLDQIFNRCMPGTYSVIYRIHKGWKASLLFKHAKGREGEAPGI